MENKRKKSALSSANANLSVAIVRKPKNKWIPFSCVSSQYVDISFMKVNH